MRFGHRTQLRNDRARESARIFGLMKTRHQQHVEGTTEAAGHTARQSFRFQSFRLAVGSSSYLIMSLGLKSGEFVDACEDP